MDKIFLHLDLFSETIFNYQWVRNKIINFH